MKSLLLQNVRSVSDYTGLSKSTIYREMNRGAFPKPLKLSPNRVAWRRDEVQDWISQLPISKGGF